MANAETVTESPEAGETTEEAALPSGTVKDVGYFEVEADGLLVDHTVEVTLPTGTLVTQPVGLVSPLVGLATVEFFQKGLLVTDSMEVVEWTVV